MKITYKSILILTILTLFAGCASTKSEDKSTADLKKEVITTTHGLNDAQTYKEAGDKMLPSILEGIKTNNYDLYSRDFTDNNKALFNKDVFEQAMKGTKKEIGELISTEYVGEWQKKDIHVLLWKAKFSKTEDDILIEMYIKKVNNEYKIAGLKLF